MIKIMLACSAGMSTSLLVTKMESAAKENNIEAQIWAIPEANLSEEISKVNQEISIQQQAYERYMQQANSVGLSDSYKKLVQEGKIDIEAITDETLNEQIQEYQEW